MDCLVSVPCPDCGATIIIPAHAEGDCLKPDDPTLPEMRRHVAFNPDIHPSFVEDVCGPSSP